MRARVSRRTLAVMMSHALRRQVAFMHALCAVATRRATRLVDAFCLALATAHTGAAGPQGGSADDAGRGHVGAKAKCDDAQAAAQ